MQPREVLWRIRQAIQRPASTFNTGFSERDWEDSLESFRECRKRPVLLDKLRAAAIFEDAPELVSPLLDAADLLVDNNFRFFGYPTVTLPQPLNWLYDPIAEVNWPDVPSSRIDHRVAGADVKWIWELNRLQHLPLLAQAWLLTDDKRYSRAAFEHLDTWIGQNPPGRGIAWRGVFEAGLRSISIAVALQGLRGAPELTVDRYRQLVQVLGLTAERCWRERSRYSSANNHLIGEMAGLAVIGMFFPDLPGAEGWERRALQTLSVEAGNLILPDGCGAEQSVAYQIATVELFHLVAALLMERDGRAPKAITDAITRSSRLLAAVVGDNDPDPRYGDADQEFALRLGPEAVRTVRQHLGLTAALGWGAGETSTYERTLAAEWYRRLTPPSTTSQMPVQSSAGDIPGAFFAPIGGLVVLRRGRQRTTMDIGPLGYLSIAAHGHADALAVTLSDNGQDIIGDPGTGSYYQHPHWRAVMRGTRAHATICVDGENQSVIGGPFLWSRHARSRLRGISLTAGIVDAEHDGYQRLPGCVTHRRWLIAPPDGRMQLVVDLVTGDGIHEVRATWPLHPELDVSRGEEFLIVTRDGLPVLEMHEASTEPTTHEDSFGDHQRDLGWWSDVLESRTPSWWLSSLCRTQLPLVIATLFCPPGELAIGGLQVRLIDDAIKVTWIDHAEQRGVNILVDRGASVQSV